MGMKSGVGVIFMGGKASRLGGISKADICVGELTCFARVHSVLATEFETVAISVAKPCNFELPTIVDWPSAIDDGGVVFSVLAILKWASDNGFNYAVTSPCDTPFVPPDLTAKLCAAADGIHPVICKTNDRTHGLHALWPCASFEALRCLVLDEDKRKIGHIHDILNSKIIEFESLSYDPFFNINTPDDVIRAEAIAKEFRL